jgi:hypothetical protein
VLVVGTGDGAQPHPCWACALLLELHTQAFLLLVISQIGSLTFAQACLGYNPPTSASHVAVIIGMHHHAFSPANCRVSGFFVRRAVF